MLACALKPAFAAQALRNLVSVEGVREFFKQRTKKLEEMGFKWKDTEWRVAWDMTPKEGDFIIKQVKKKPEAVPQN